MQGVANFSHLWLHFRELGLLDLGVLFHDFTRFFVARFLSHARHAPQNLQSSHRHVRIAHKINVSFFKSFASRCLRGWNIDLLSTVSSLRFPPNTTNDLERKNHLLSNEACVERLFLARWALRVGGGVRLGRRLLGRRRRLVPIVAAAVVIVRSVLQTTPHSGSLFCRESDSSRWHIFFLSSAKRRRKGAHGVYARRPRRGRRRRGGCWSSTCLEWCGWWSWWTESSSRRRFLPPAVCRDAQLHYLHNPNENDRREPKNSMVRWKPEDDYAWYQCLLVALFSTGMSPWRLTFVVSPRRTSAGCRSCIRARAAPRLESSPSACCPRSDPGWCSPSSGTWNTKHCCTERDNKHQGSEKTQTEAAQAMLISTCQSTDFCTRVPALPESHPHAQAALRCTCWVSWRRIRERPGAVGRSRRAGRPAARAPGSGPAGDPAAGGRSWRGARTGSRSSLRLQHKTVAISLTQVGSFVILWVCLLSRNRMWITMPWKYGEDVMILRRLTWERRLYSQICWNRRGCKMSSHTRPSVFFIFSNKCPDLVNSDSHCEPWQTSILQNHTWFTLTEKFFLRHTRTFFVFKRQVTCNKARQNHKTGCYEACRKPEALHRKDLYS